MKFTLKIDLENEAMQEGADLAEALRKVANAIEPRTHAGLEQCESHIWDRNGNKVGRWAVKGG